MKVGRPTKITPATVKKLTEAFKIGANVEEACAVAHITKPTVFLSTSTSKLAFPLWF